MTRPPETTTTRALLEDAASRVVRYLETLPGRRVQPTAEAVRGLSAWDTALPDGPTDARRWCDCSTR